MAHNNLPHVIVIRVISNLLPMKYAKIFHNPGAGNGEPNREKLIELMKSAGFKCSYTSIKQEGWEDMKIDREDFILIAGGDGTVRKVAARLLDKKLLEKQLPIALLPLGTANNIAHALALTGDEAEAIETWKNQNVKSFDIGTITGLKNPAFFLEGIGYGIFPYLIRKMKNSRQVQEPVKVKIARSLELLLDITLTCKAKPCHLKIDGMECSGEFLLAEVMNTPSIGPNLNIAPSADPGDGELEVVLIAEEQREDFAAYIRNKIAGKERPPFLSVIKAKKLEMRWEDTILHVDDEYMELTKPVSLHIELMSGRLGFMAGEKELSAVLNTPSPIM